MKEDKKMFTINIQYRWKDVHYTSFIYSNNVLYYWFYVKKYLLNMKILNFFIFERFLIQGTKMF